jgi:hypothetical protein
MGCALGEAAEPSSSLNGQSTKVSADYIPEARAKTVLWKVVWLEHGQSQHPKDGGDDEGGGDGGSKEFVQIKDGPQ